MKISSPEAMIELGISLAKDHKILLLQWDLGAGKTLLTKGFARWLGIDDHLVQSPTYAYINVYENKLNHQKNEWNEDVLDDWVIPTTWETVSTNPPRRMKWLQNSKAGRWKLLHIDMYRLESYEDVVQKWILAQMHEHDYIVIEWPKFIDQLGLTGYTIIDITKISEEEREVEFLKKEISK